MFLRNLPRGVPNRSGSGVSRGLGGVCTNSPNGTTRRNNMMTIDSEKGGNYFNDRSSRTENDSTTVVIEDEDVFKVKHRYLPIISGLACPFSVLLDIPGLTEKWYIREVGYTVVETQANPILLDVALAFSIVLGLVANAALIMRFLEKRVKLNTIISILCLTVHDVINAVVLISFGVIHSNNDGFNYGTAYWLTIASTAASMTANITLSIDLYQTKEFTKHGSGLTEKQRSLVIAVMGLLCYIGLGSLCFSFLLNLTYIDSLYFTISTITSVGLGDISPTTLASRLFSFPYDILGLVGLAFTVAIARETIIETFEDSYRLRRDLLAVKNRERKMEKAKRVKERRERREQELKDGLSMDRVNTINLPNGEVLIVNTGGGGGRGGGAGRAQRKLDYDDETSRGISSGKAKLNQILRRLGWMKPFEPHLQFNGFNITNGNGLGIERTLTATSLSQEQSYASFRKEMNKEQSKEFKLKIAISMSLFWIFWLVGAGIFHITEDWNYFEALYFCFIFFTTIGYGDFAPKSSAGRAFFVAWSILGIATMTLVLSVVTESWGFNYRSVIEDAQSKKEFDRNFDNGSDPIEVVENESNSTNNDNYLSLPEKLRDCARNYHEHATYFLFGRTGDVPPKLQLLIDDTEKLDELTKARDGSEAEAKHYLFMISYERSLDNLLKTADQLAQISIDQTQELEKMKELNERLGQALKSNSTDSINSTISLSSNPLSKPVLHKLKTHLYVSRPPGGIGDNLIEDALMIELDGQVTKGPKGKNYLLGDGTVDESSPTVGVAVGGGGNLLHSSNPFEIYTEASTLLNKFLISPPTPTALDSRPLTPYTLSPLPMTPGPSSAVSISTPSSDSSYAPLISNKPSFGEISRVPTLTFSEPERSRSNTGTSSVGSPGERKFPRRSSLGGSSSGGGV